MSLIATLVNRYSNFKKDRTKVIVYMSGTNTETPEWFSLNFLHSDKESLKFYETGGLNVRDIDVFKENLDRIRGKDYNVIFAERIPEDLSPSTREYFELRNSKGKKVFNFQPLDKKDITYLLRERD